MAYSDKARWEVCGRYHGHPFDHSGVFLIQFRNPRQGPVLLFRLESYILHRTEGSLHGRIGVE